MNAGETSFVNRPVTLNGNEYPVAVFVPNGWTAARKWPVVLFLHGAGERGTDGVRPTEVGLSRALREHPERFPAIVVLPQAPPDQRWMGETADAAMRALDDAIREFSGDPDRVSLTGLSLGGFGVWHLALSHPDRFAALVPVCAGIVPNGTATSVRQSPLTMDHADPYAFTAARLRHVPVWMFHGADDTVIVPSESRKMAQALRDADGNVRHVEYEGVGHDAWNRAYGEEELWSWLFAQKRVRSK